MLPYLAREPPSVRLRCLRQQLDAVADALDREAMVLGAVGESWCVHPPSISHTPTAPRVDSASTIYSVARLPVFLLFLPRLTTFFWVADAAGSCSEVRMIFSLTQ